MMKRIVVTGGAGFLGSNLSIKLLSMGHEVICIDNLFSGRKENIANLLGNNRFKFIEHDIVDTLDIQCDEIYNLACPASPKYYQKYPIKTFKTNAIGTMNLLELANKNKAKILQASTSEIYGDPKIHPQVENYWGNVNPIGIRSCYDEGKRGAETLFMDYHREFNLDTKIVRIFNTYGPKMSIYDGRVVSNFIVQSLQNKNITIYGNGNQTRSFCYVDDLIEGIIKMMDTENCFTGPVNLGNPQEITVLELAEIIIEMTNSKSKIEFCELPKDDPCKRKPDITLASSQIGWNPKVSLVEGLSKTIEYFKSEIANF